MPLGQLRSAVLGAPVDSEHFGVMWTQAAGQRHQVSSQQSTKGLPRSVKHLTYQQSVGKRDSAQAYEDQSPRRARIEAKGEETESCGAQYAHKGNGGRLVDELPQVPLGFEPSSDVPPMVFAVPDCKIDGKT